ncbi:MAG: hypothetical protein ACTSRZ_01925 [Promethearchaeota archaeon]
MSKQYKEHLLNSILQEFKELNLEFLFKMIESMNLSGLLYDPRIIQAMHNIRIEDFITWDMIDTFIPDKFRNQHNIDPNLVRAILIQLFANFYGNRPLLFYNHRKYARSTAAPHMIVIMAQLVEVEPNDNVLILGSKSGYLESIIQDMDEGIKLYIIEKVPEIYRITKYNIDRIKAGDKIKIYNMDPVLDLDKLPIQEFDKIFITGYLKALPKAIYKRLKIGGLICGPFGNNYQQTLIRYFKLGEDQYDEEDQGKVIFSPLITDFIENNNNSIKLNL